MLHQVSTSREHFCCIFFTFPCPSHQFLSIFSTVFCLFDINRWSGDMEIYGSITTSASGNKEERKREKNDTYSIFTADLTYYGNLTYAPRNSSINSVPLLYSVYIPDNHGISYFYFFFPSCSTSCFFLCDIWND